MNNIILFLQCALRLKAFAFFLDRSGSFALLIIALNISSSHLLHHVNNKIMIHIVYDFKDLSFT